jgi:hypothetical protein
MSSRKVIGFALQFTPNELVQTAALPTAVSEVISPNFGRDTGCQDGYFCGLPHLLQQNAVTIS